MIDDAFSALVSAWHVTLTASCLFIVAVALAPYWDTAIYLKSLQEALMMDHM
jgi:hypothetical protein